jgi:predicted metalloprotease with PDZ domain
VPVLGHFPRERVQVIVVPIGARSEPVPWAHVLRGGGPAVEFFVDPNWPLEEFDADWTATHEFSHLLLPYVAYNDRWLSEGLASYYQNVLRARDGRLDEREAWQALHAGFRRGRKATRDETLRQATRAGRGATMRIYWAGAALALEADVRLRQATGGDLSLDEALRRFNECCVEAGGSWRALDLLAELERLTGLGVFRDLARDYPSMRSFPDLQPLYRELGLVAEDGLLRLGAGAEHTGLRRDIMQRPEAAPASLAGR